jgi:hypothetical protein
MISVLIGVVLVGSLIAANVVTLSYKASPSKLLDSGPLGAKAGRDAQDPFRADVIS